MVGGSCEYKFLSFYYRFFGRRLFLYGDDFARLVFRPLSFVVRFLMGAGGSVSPEREKSVGVSLSSSSTNVLELTPPTIFNGRVLASAAVPGVITRIGIFLWETYIRFGTESGYDYCACVFGMLTFDDY